MVAIKAYLRFSQDSTSFWTPSLEAMLPGGEDNGFHCVIVMVSAGEWPMVQGFGAVDVHDNAVDNHNLVPWDHDCSLMEAEGVTPKLQRHCATTVDHEVKPKERKNVECKGLAAVVLPDSCNDNDPKKDLH